MSDSAASFAAMTIQNAHRPSDQELHDLGEGQSSYQERRLIRREVRDAALSVELDRTAMNEYQSEFLVSPDANFLSRVLDATSVHLSRESPSDCGSWWSAYCGICRTHAIVCRAFRTVDAIDRAQERLGKVAALVLSAVGLFVGIPALITWIVHDAAQMDRESQNQLSALLITLLGGLVFGIIAFGQASLITLFGTRPSLYGGFFVNAKLRRRGLLAAATAIRRGGGLLPVAPARITMAVHNAAGSRRCLPRWTRSASPIKSRTPSQYRARAGKPRSAG